jgi:hypothetical protein
MSNRSSRKSGKNRRQQTPKLGGNKAIAVAMQELRRSSATTPVPSGKAYKRKPKHREW